MRRRYTGRGEERMNDEARRREFARLRERGTRFIDDAPFRGARGGKFGDEYGRGSGAEAYGGRDYAHTGSFTGSPSDFSEPSGRHDERYVDYGSGDRGYASRVRDDARRGNAEGYGQRKLETAGRSGGRGVERGGERATAFEDERPSFGMNLQGNFGFDRGGEGAGSSYFGGSDRGRRTLAMDASTRAHRGGDVDRGWAGRASEGGSDAYYSGGMNYGFGGGAYRSGLAHDRFEEIPDRFRSPEQTMRDFRGVGPKTFRRSDERLRELVSERLEDHDEIDASDIEVTVDGGVVRLTGNVPDRRMKRLAAMVAEEIHGISDVENSIRISK